MQLGVVSQRTRHFMWAFICNGRTRINDANVLRRGYTSKYYVHRGYHEHSLDILLEQFSLHSSTVVARKPRLDQLWSKGTQSECKHQFHVLILNHIENLAISSFGEDDTNAMEQTWNKNVFHYRLVFCCTCFTLTAWRTVDINSCRVWIDP